MRKTNLTRLIALSAIAIASAAVWANELRPDQLFEKLSPSIWSVISSDNNGRTLGQGSAVVIAPGTLITNCHVLAKAASFVVKQDNVAYGASLQHADTERDLCQISVRNFNAPQVEILSVENLKVGQKAYAIGNPRGLEATLSDGLVSGLRRSDDNKFVEFVQTTAPISPGSSGGGLFDSQGKLIGITTLIRRDSQNLNFAVPSNWIAEVPQRAQAALAARTNAQNSPVVTSGAQAGAEKRGSYYVGQELEYTIIDRMTNLRQSVALKVDRFDGDSIVFNGGQRTENMNGRVLTSKQRMLSEMDSLNHLGGWVTKENAQQTSWTINTGESSFGNAKFELTAQRVGESSLNTPAGEFNTIVIKFEGYRDTRTGSGNIVLRTRYLATAWYSTQLNRLVKFSVEIPGSAGRLDEEIVLQKIR
jgi:serine protease Do